MGNSHRHRYQLDWLPRRKIIWVRGKKKEEEQEKKKKEQDLVVKLVYLWLYIQYFFTIFKEEDGGDTDRYTFPIRDTHTKKRCFNNHFGIKELNCLCRLGLCYCFYFDGSLGGQRRDFLRFVMRLFVADSTSRSSGIIPTLASAPKVIRCGDKKKITKQ